MTPTSYQSMQDIVPQKTDDEGGEEEREEEGENAFLIFPYLHTVSHQKETGCFNEKTSDNLTQNVKGSKPSSPKALAEGEKVVNHLY